MFDVAAVVRWSAWPAVLCYAMTIALRLLRPGPRSEQWIRGLWLAGWIALVLHIAVAITLFHGGSWNAAYEHTARRTFSAVGWNWGGGVWFNLAAAVVWGFDLVRMWRRPIVTARPPSWQDWASQLYLAFMMFNATVVFGSLPARIVGGVIVAMLCILALHRHREAF